MPNIGDLFADVLVDAGIEFVFGMPGDTPGVVEIAIADYAHFKMRP